MALIENLPRHLLSVVTGDHDHALLRDFLPRHCDPWDVNAAVRWRTLLIVWAHTVSILIASVPLACAIVGIRVLLVYGGRPPGRWPSLTEGLLFLAFAIVLASILTGLELNDIRLIRAGKPPVWSRAILRNAQSPPPAAQGADGGHRSRDPVDLPGELDRRDATLSPEVKATALAQLAQDTRSIQSLTPRSRPDADDGAADRDGDQGRGSG